MTPALHQLQLPPVVVMPLQLLQLHPQVAILQVHVQYSLFVNKPEQASTVCVSWHTCAFIATGCC